MTTWGICATILAETEDILRFAAYHLEAGAHRLYLYLDAENPAALAALKAHPRIKVITCDARYWAKTGRPRPKKHQVRQTANATHAYRRQTEVDWLIHMDVDEFLVSQQPVARILTSVPADQPIARIRPMEALAGDGHAFKAFIPNGPDRAPMVAQIYPTFGHSLNGGFLSHLAGKVFVRTGMTGIRIQIHNVFQHDEMLKAPERQAGIDLAHCHARSWQDWIAAYRYRHEKGSYRAELGPNRPPSKGGVSMHDLFASIEADSGMSGLRAFFDEVCADTPALRERLDKHGLLRVIDLDLATKRAKHFPQIPPGGTSV